MEHRVFISHSSADRHFASAICHYWEEAGIRCWIAPRDIDTIDWAGSIMRGLALTVRFNGEASMVTVRTKEAIADNLAKKGDTAGARAMYLALELDMEKNFGGQCPYVLRLREKGEAL